MLLAALLLGSCTNDYKKVSITSCRLTEEMSFGLRQGKMHATVDFEVIVDNPTASKFEVVDANMVIYEKDGTEFGYVNTVQNFVILPKGERPVTVGLDFTVNDPMKILFGGGLNIKSKEADFTISIKQNGIGPKKIEYKKVPVRVILNAINLTSE